MAELGPLGLHPLDKGIGAFPQFTNYPGFSLKNLSAMSQGESAYPWLDEGSGATSDAPGLSFSDGTPGTFGAGGQTIGQIGGNLLSGGLKGLSGQLAESLGLPSIAGKVAAKALGFGVPGLPLSWIDIILGGAKKVADQTLKNTNMKVGPVRFGAPPVVPDIHFDATGLPTNSDNTEPDVPDGNVTVGQMVTLDENGNINMSDTGNPGAAAGAVSGVDGGVSGAPAGSNGEF